MSDTKFTAGPWVFGEDGYVLSEATGEHVAQALPWNFVGSAEIEHANGCLVESAPRLYHALESLRDCIMETRGPNAHKAVAEADSVLAQARGETDAT